MYYAYAFMNVIVYIIYAVFLIIGAHMTQPLFGLLPLLVFYTAKYTGGFFWYSFAKMRTTQLFRWLIVCAVVGCILGVVSLKYPAILNVSAILLGLCCSVLLPTYTTVLKTQKGSKKSQMLWSALLACCWLLILVPVITSKQFSFVFLWIGLAFFFLLFLPVKNVPKIITPTRPAQRYTGLIAFIVLSAMLFIVKFVRTVEWQTYFSSIVLVILFLVTCAIMWYSWHHVRAFSTTLHLYSYADGLLVAFFFMVTVFEHWLTAASTLHVVYIPYIIGVLLSFILPFKFSRNTLLLIVLLCSWGLVYEPLITVVAIGIGYSHTKFAADLNGDYYKAAIPALKENALLVKNRFYRLGGISIQVLIVACIVSLSWQRAIDLPEVMHTVIPTILPVITIGFNSLMTIFIGWLVLKNRPSSN